MKPFHTLIAFCILSAIPLSCGTSVSGVETTNGFSVSASAENVAGEAPPNSQIYLCDTGYIPFIGRGTGFQTSADLSGRFDFAVPPGSYSVTAITPDGRTAGLRIESSEGVPDAPRKATGTPQLPGSLSGSISSGTADSLLIYLAGMCHYRVIAQQRTFTISKIPPGSYRLKVIALTGTAAASQPLYETDITVNPAQTTPLGELVVQK